MLIDAGDVIVHLFRPEVRSFYNLERMWAFGDAPPAGRPRRRRASLTRLVLLHIVARGRIGRGPEAELVDRYLKRIAWPTQVTELPDTRRQDARRSTAGPRIVLLDEKGESAAARRAFAERLGRWRDDGVREARFLIGAADGFDDAERARGRPAALLRRARPGRTCWRARCSPSNCGARRSILANHPYHREG